MARSTRAAVSGSTPGSPLTTRDTVIRLTPAAAATSRMVGRLIGSRRHARQDGMPPHGALRARGPYDGASQAGVPPRGVLLALIPPRGQGVLLALIPPCALWERYQLVASNWQAPGSRDRVLATVSA